MRSISSSHFILFYIISISNHDAIHLVVDLFSLSLILEWTILENADGDHLEPAEDPLEVDLVASLLIHVVLVGIIKHDSKFAICSLLTEEGPSMSSDILIEILRTRNKELSVLVGVDKFLFDKFFDIEIHLFALKSLERNNGENFIVFYQEVPEGRN